MNRKQTINFVVSLLVIFALPVFTWFVWYPWVGYSDTSLLAMELLFFAAGVGLLIWQKKYPKAVGLTGKQLLSALILLTAAYAFILAAASLVRHFLQPEIRLFRDSYQLTALLRNWFLTGLGEEILFCGILFNTLSRLLKQSKSRWLAVLLTALLFSLWHLPGHLAIGREVGDLLARLGIHFFSWLFFGAIYALSGNLWLAGLTHAASDYALLPVIVNQPLFGLLLMLFIVFCAAFRLPQRWLFSAAPKPDRLSGAE
ncbi:MAG: CPBP family intramembrane metalloprotease [Anaerolineaceae bacterium]|nr:CPBP family intramembrane metalloprotease [Anaerolineaceae bacterium]